MTSIEDAPDPALLTRSGSGDRVAFGLLYDRHVRAVHAQARSVVREAALAEEVTQDTFVLLWQKSRSVRIVDDSVLPWLLITARFVGLNAARRRGRDAARSATLDTAKVATDDEAAREAAELHRQVDAALATLSETDRRLYDLCIDGDHSYERAARELGISHGAVRNRLSRLRARLRADLSALRGI